MLNQQVKDAGPIVVYAFEPMETMGDRIRRLREAQNLTQTQLGELCGVSKSAVSQWEDGTTADIKLVPFLKLQAALRTDGHYLVFGPGRGPAPESGPGPETGATGQFRRPSRPRSRQ